jgi:hypothetical protein
MKRRLTFTELHGVIPQNTELFIVITLTQPRQPCPILNLWSSNTYLRQYLGKL